MKRRNLSLLQAVLAVLAAALGLLLGARLALARQRARTGGAVTRDMRGQAGGAYISLTQAIRARKFEALE